MSHVESLVWRMVAEVFRGRMAFRSSLFLETSRSWKS